MKFKHEELEVFQLSMNLIQKVYALSEKFPSKEVYGLSSQLSRAAVSISLNISEGSGKYSRDDFARFIRNSIGSLLETDTCLKIALKLKYLNELDYSAVDSTIQELYFKLIALHKSLKK